MNKLYNINWKISFFSIALICLFIISLVNIFPTISQAKVIDNTDEHVSDLNDYEIKANDPLPESMSVLHADTDSPASEDEYSYSGNILTLKANNLKVKGDTETPENVHIILESNPSFNTLTFENLNIYTAEWEGEFEAIKIWRACEEDFHLNIIGMCKIDSFCNFSIDICNKCTGDHVFYIWGDSNSTLKIINGDYGNILFRADIFIESHQTLKFSGSLFLDFISWFTCGNIELRYNYDLEFTDNTKTILKIHDGSEAAIWALDSAITIKDNAAVEIDVSDGYMGGIYAYQIRILDNASIDINNCTNVGLVVGFSDTRISSKRVLEISTTGYVDIECLWCSAICVSGEYAESNAELIFDKASYIRLASIDSQYPANALDCYKCNTYIDTGNIYFTGYGKLYDGQEWCGAICSHGDKPYLNENLEMCGSEELNATEEEANLPCSFLEYDTEMYYGVCWSTFVDSPNNDNMKFARTVVIKEKTFNVSGTVIDSNSGMPIENVKIQYCKFDESTSNPIPVEGLFTITNKYGEYEIKDINVANNLPGVLMLTNSSYETTYTSTIDNVETKDIHIGETEMKAIEKPTPSPEEPLQPESQIKDLIPQTSDGIVILMVVFLLIGIFTFRVMSWNIEK